MRRLSFPCLLIIGKNPSVFEILLVLISTVFVSWVIIESLNRIILDISLEVSINVLQASCVKLI